MQNTVLQGYTYIYTSIRRKKKDSEMTQNEHSFGGNFLEGGYGFLPCYTSGFFFFGCVCLRTKEQLLLKGDVFHWQAGLLIFLMLLVCVLS